VDRTLQETESEFGELEMNESAGEGEEFLGDIVGGLFGGELESNEQGFLGEEEVFEQNFLGEQEFEQGFLGESEAVFDEVTEMELAAELLGAQNEEELEQFIGNLLKKAGKFASSAIKGPLGQTLKSVAKVALPAAGAALGNLVLPGVGGALGGKLASAAGSMFGLEFEGLSPQDREFEAAKRVVRFGGAAAKKVARTPTSVSPRHAVKAATIAAARKHIPGLLRPKVVHHIKHVLRQAHAHAARAQGHRGGNRGRSTYGGAYSPGPTYGGAPTYASPTFGGGYIAPSADTPSYSGGSTNGSGYGPSGATRQGKWYRRGRKIVLVGV